MTSLLKFLVLRLLGWRVAAVLALLGLVRTRRTAARRDPVRR